jgi:hypothetical protein
MQTDLGLTEDGRDQALVALLSGRPLAGSGLE